VSAAPIEVLLTQADDASTFWAAQRGSEYGSWMETTEGYSIVEVGGVWYYAQQEADGTLGATQTRAEGPPPATRATWPKHLRPPMTQEQEYALIPLSARPPDTRSLTRTQPVLTILVNFSDATFTYNDASFQTLIYGATSSVKAFYLENSYSNFTVAPATESYGTANDGIVHVTMGTTHPNLGNTWGAWRLLVSSYIAAADASVNFAGFDANGDGIIAPSELSIVLILAGYENSYDSSTPGVWGHMSFAPGFILDGKTLSGYTAFGEKHGTHQATIGIMCHELGHLMFGLPDLYDTDNSSEGVGEWCLMGSGSWNTTTVLGDTPSHFSAPIKAFLDITTPGEVMASTAGVSVLQGYANASIQKVWVDLYRSPFSEYFLLENRQKSGYDFDVPGAGLLIWHVDGSKTTNANETHKLIDLEEADGLANLDAKVNRGDTGDPFPGSSNNTTFNGTTNPNSDNYAGADTEVIVNSISASAATMTANITPRSNLGNTLYHDEYGQSGDWGFNNTTAYTAIQYTNDTAMDRLDGFEVYINDTTATVDFSLYTSISANTPTGLISSQTGFAGVLGWNRFLLTTSQSFPQSSTRVVVLKIVNAAYGYPVRIDYVYGSNSGLASLSAVGSAGTFGAMPYDPAQTVLLKPSQKDPVYANFSFNGAESGTAANPYNTFAEALAGVLTSGTINLKGDAADTSSGWTGTISTAVTLAASPVGAVQIGAAGGGS
jgi:M6 family metalloprotease-like protein